MDYATLQVVYEQQTLSTKDLCPQIENLIVRARKIRKPQTTVGPGKSRYWHLI
jgi:hypothetical protein